MRRTNMGPGRRTPLRRGRTGPKARADRAAVAAGAEGGIGIPHTPAVGWGPQELRQGTDRTTGHINAVHGPARSVPEAGLPQKSFSQSLSGSRLGEPVLFCGTGGGLGVICLHFRQHLADLLPDDLVLPDGFVLGVFHVKSVFEVYRLGPGR